MLSAVLLVSTAVHTLANMVQQSIPLMGTRLIEVLGISTAQFGVLIGAVAIGNVLVLSWSGFVADRFGIRRVLTAATAVCAVGTIAVAAWAEFLWVAGLLVVVGMAMGTTITAGGGAVFVSAPPDRRGLMVSIRQTGLPVGGMMAALLVPALLHYADWRAVFLVEGGMFLVVALCVGRTTYPTASQVSHHARTRMRRDEVRSLVILGTLGMLFGGAQWGFLGFLTLQMTDRFSLTFELAALVFLSMQVCGLLSRVLFGWVSDRRAGNRLGVLAAISVTGASAMLLLAGLPDHTHAVALAAVSGVGGFCLLGWNGVLITAFAECSSQHHASFSIGIGLTLVGVGTIAAPTVFGLVGIARSPVLFLALAGMLILAAAGLLLYAAVRRT